MGIHTTLTSTGTPSIQELLVSPQTPSIAGSDLIQIHSASCPWVHPRSATKQPQMLSRPLYPVTSLTHMHQWASKTIFKPHILFSSLSLPTQRSSHLTSIMPTPSCTHTWPRAPCPIHQPAQPSAHQQSHTDRPTNTHMLCSLQVTNPDGGT